MEAQYKAIDLCQKVGNTTFMAEDCNEGYTLPLRVSKLIVKIFVKEIMSNNIGKGSSGIEVVGDEIHCDENYWNNMLAELEKL